MLRGSSGIAGGGIYLAHRCSAANARTHTTAPAYRAHPSQRTRDGVEVRGRRQGRGPSRPRVRGASPDGGGGRSPRSRASHPPCRDQVRAGRVKAVPRDEDDDSLTFGSLVREKFDSVLLLRGTCKARAAVP